MLTRALSRAWRLQRAAGATLAVAAAGSAVSTGSEREAREERSKDQLEIGGGAPVPEPGFSRAALAGVARSRISQLVGAGDLRRNADGQIHAADAKRWLSGRGVRGIA